MKKINADGEMKIIVEDLSSNGTFVNGELVNTFSYFLLKLRNNRSEKESMLS